MAADAFFLFIEPLAPSRRELFKLGLTGVRNAKPAVSASKRDIGFIGSVKVASTACKK